MAAVGRVNGLRWSVASRSIASYGLSMRTVRRVVDEVGLLQALVGVARERWMVTGRDEVSVAWSGGPDAQERVVIDGSEAGVGQDAGHG